jgi:acyl carrier protein
VTINQSQSELLVDLRRIITRGAGTAPEVLETGDDSTLEELGLDSLATMEVRSIVETEFGVVIPEDAEQLTVHQLAEFLSDQLKVRS